MRQPHPNISGETASPGRLSSLHSPVGPWATHFGAGLCVVLAALGDFQCELTPLLPVSRPAEPGWGRGGGTLAPSRECRLTWPGDQAGGEAAREEPCLPLQGNRASPRLP